MTVLALLAYSEGFTMSPVANKISVRSTNTSFLKMTAAEDEVAKILAKAAKMRDEAQQLEKVRHSYFLYYALRRAVQREHQWCT